MPTIQLFYSGFAFLSVSLLCWIAYQGWQRRQVSGAYAFVGMVLAVAWWTFFYLLELILPNTQAILIANQVKFIGIATLPVAWVIFAAQYSNRYSHISLRDRGLLLIIPGITILLAFTSPDLHSFFFRELRLVQELGFPTILHEYGTWYSVHVAYSYTLILVGAYWLVVAAMRSLTVYEARARWIMIAVAVPLAGNIATITDLVEYVDLAPLLFTVSGFMFLQLLQEHGSLETALISYKSIIAQLPNAVMVVDKNNRVLAVNPPLLRFVNKTEDALIGEPATAITPQPPQVLAQTDVLDAQEDEIMIAGRYIDLLVSPLRNADGDVQGRIFVFQDVTVRRQTESALVANERRYRTLFENSNDAIFILDLDHTVITANEQAAAMLDVDLARLLHKPIEQFIAMEERQSSRLIHQALVRGDDVGLYERTFLQTDDTPVPSEVSLTLVRDGEGQPLHIQMIVRDITERKQAANAMNQRIAQLAVLRHVDEEVSRTLDVDNVLTVALNAAVRLSGADAGFIALGDDDNAMTIARVVGDYPASVQGMTLDGDAGIIGEVLHERQPRLVMNIGDYPAQQPMLDDTEALMALPLISQDRLVGVLNLETDHRDYFDENNFQFIRLLAGRLAVAVDNARLYEYVRQQLDELQEVYDELRRAEELKTDMIRIANHDLQNPLSIIDGFLHLLEQDREQFSEEHQEFFAMMQNSVTRMKNILRDFLSLESFLARQQNSEPLDIHALLQDAIEEYAPQVERKSQTLLTDIDFDAPPIIMGDKPMLYEAMTNLISNALKYTPDGGEIKLQLTSTDETVTFAVHDTGYGIPENRQARMFEPFYRPKTRESEHIEGTGLGLYLVKNIIERHKGEMMFRSEYRKGSTFGFRLPPAPPDKRHGDDDTPKKSDVPHHETQPV